jgi:hypothetical protein
VTWTNQLGGLEEAELPFNVAFKDIQVVRTKDVRQCNICLETRVQFVDCGNIAHSICIHCLSHVVSTSMSNKMVHLHQIRCQGDGSCYKYYSIASVQSAIGNDLVGELELKQRHEEVEKTRRMKTQEQMECAECFRVHERPTGSSSFIACKCGHEFIYGCGCRYAFGYPCEHERANALIEEDKDFEGFDLQFLDTEAATGIHQSTGTHEAADVIQKVLDASPNNIGSELISTSHSGFEPFSIDLELTNTVQIGGDVSSQLGVDLLPNSIASSLISTSQGTISNMFKGDLHTISRATNNQFNQLNYGLQSQYHNNIDQYQLSNDKHIPNTAQQLHHNVSRASSYNTNFVYEAKDSNNKVQRFDSIKAMAQKLGINKGKIYYALQQGPEFDRTTHYRFRKIERVTVL